MPNYGEFGLDNTRFKQDIEDAKNALNGIGRTAEHNAASMDSAFKKAGQMAAGYFSIAAAARFVSQLVQVRGEFQKLEVGFTTMLGSKEKSNQLMAQMVDTAMKTPFTLQEVAGGAKQLLAYQVAQEDVNGTLIRLGNISSGLGVPLERLIMVYGQVKAKGKLMGDDLRQFTEAGVPMIHELAKSMGVADGEVQKLISSGKVGFPEVQKVIENMTGAGGMFYNLMEAQSKTVTGQLSNLEDAWSKMLNQIGADNDGVIYGAISGVSSLITNYETVGKVLAGVIATVGVYKTGLMILTIQQNRATAAATAEALAQSYVTGSMGMTTIAEARLMVAREAGTTSIYKMITAQLGLNAAVMANPYVLATIGLIALGVAVWSMNDSLTATERAQNAVNSITEANAKSTDELKSRTSSLTGIVNDHNTTLLAQVTAFTELQDKYPEILANLDLQTFKALGATEQQKLLNAAIEAQGSKKENDELSKQKELLKTVQSISEVSGTTLQLTKEQNDAVDKINEQSGISYWDAILKSGKDYSDIQKEVVAKLEQQKEAKLELIRMAEIENLPLAEKLDYYNKQKKALEVQRDLLKESSDKAFAATQNVKGLNDKMSLLSGHKEAPKMWDMTDILIKGINKQVDDLAGKIDNLKPKEKASDGTKADWEAKKKEAEDGLEKISKEKKATTDGAASWKKFDEQRRKAVEALKFWDFSETAANKEISVAQKVANEKKKLKKEIAQEELNEDRKVIDMKLQNKQEEINRMPESFAKELAQLTLNNEKRTEEIKRARENELKIEQDIQEKIWLLTAPRNKKGEVVGTFDRSKVSLPTTTAEVYNQATDNNKDNLDFGKKSIIDKLSKEYQSFDDRRREIDKKYREDGSVIKSNFKGDELLSKLAELKIKNKEALQAVDKDQTDSAFKNNDLLVSLFDDMSGKSVADLRKIADHAAELFDYLKGTDVKDITPKFGLSKEDLISLKSGKADMRDISEQIKSVNEQADKLETGFKKVATAIKNVSEGTSQVNVGKLKVKEGERLVKSGDSELISEGSAKIKSGQSDIIEGNAKIKTGAESMAASYQTASFFVGQAQGLLSAISTKEGDAADQASKSIGAVMKIADATMQGYQQGGPAGAAIAFTMATITQIFESEKAHQAALKKLNDEKIAQQKEYNDLLMKQNYLLKNAETIYGTDAFGKSIGYAQVADKTRNASKNAVSALSGSTVQTGSHKGGLFGWGGEVADYSGLLATYPKLIDGQGNLNKELAQSILDNQNLDESSKKALQTALDYTKDYEDALKSMSDYLNSVFGSLGQDMMTAITDNLNSSQDAMDAFGKSAGKTIEKLMSDIAYSMFFADKFKKMQDQALAIQADGGKTPEQKAAEQTKLLGDFYGGIGGTVKDAQAWLKQNKDMAAQSGFDLWNEASTRTATSKGFTSMSQDSSDELNGRFTAMQGHTYAISESMKILQANSSQSLKHLAGIETNTARLEAIEAGISSVKSGIDDINTKGIFIKV